jgi:putative DNA primase/helicase
VTPAETTDCPLWLRFLHEASGGDAELVSYLQRFSGYLLTGDTREHALLFIYGPGGNGKSVFLNMVTARLIYSSLESTGQTVLIGPARKKSTSLRNR